MTLVRHLGQQIKNKGMKAKKISMTPRTFPKLIFSHQSRLLSKSLEPRLAASALESWGGINLLTNVKTFQNYLTKFRKTMEKWNDWRKKTWINLAIGEPRGRKGKAATTLGILTPMNVIFIGLSTNVWESKYFQRRNRPRTELSLSEWSSLW